MSEVSVSLRTVASGQQAVPNNSTVTIGPWTLRTGEMLTPFVRVIPTSQAHMISYGNDNADLRVIHMVDAAGVVTFDLVNTTNDDVTFDYAILGTQG